ncbi:MAG: hypothetical protein KBA72_00075 [Thermoanaerobaculia bacterium]|jgi:hypothetical protein|nr:hypothetical protein [Thermoanaerobaculia bacterium]
MSSARTRVVTLSVLLVAVGVCALFAPAAEATVYSVALKNGTTFDTRYQPEEASWDPDKVVLMTEFGNRIALAASEIESVTVDSESRGFGHQLNNTTMALGWAPNDALDANSDEGKAALAADAAASAAAANAPQVYNQQQFVEPGALTGLPVWMTGVNAVPQVQPSQPSAPPQQ